MKTTQQDRTAHEEVSKNPMTRLTVQVPTPRVLDLPEVRSAWIRDPYPELSKKSTEITQQDWIVYEEVRENPIAKLTGQVLFARVLGLPREKLEWIRNHDCELSARFNMER